MTFVAQRIGFTLINSTGGLNGLYEYPVESAVDPSDLTKSAFNRLGANFSTGSAVNALATSGDATYIAGNFTSGNMRNIIATKGNDANIQSLDAGLNGEVKSMEAAGRHVLVLGDMNDYQDSPALSQNLVAGTSLQNLWNRAPVNNRYSFQYDGQVEALDHLFVDDYLAPRVKEIRYVHFDNDYFGRSNPDSPIEVSDHDPPVAVLKVPAAR